MTLLVLLLPALPGAREGVGLASGTSVAEYRLHRTTPPLPPAYENAGYRQEILSEKDITFIRVSVDLSPRPLRSPFSFRERALPAYLPAPLRALLKESLSRCLRAGEAAERVLFVLRTSIRYREKVAFREEPSAVASSGEASCVGMTRLAASLLSALGIPSREVLGLKIPPETGARNLEGGILHAWLELDFGEEGRVFCDPSRTVAWVPETFVLLRIGDGLSPEGLEGLRGARFETLSRQDRIFFEPSPGRTCVLWSRPGREGFTGTVISGKVLGEGDTPLPGRAILRGNGGTVSMELWEGNFFFRDLEPATYFLGIEAPGVTTAETLVELRPMEKERLLVYSRKVAERGPDGTGR